MPYRKEEIKKMKKEQMRMGEIQSKIIEFKEMKISDCAKLESMKSKVQVNKDEQDMETGKVHKIVKDIFLKYKLLDDEHADLTSKILKIEIRKASEYSRL